jgi:hypothetical protein
MTASVRDDNHTFTLKVDHIAPQPLPTNNGISEAPLEAGDIQQTTIYILPYALAHLTTPTSSNLLHDLFVQRYTLRPSAIKLQTSAQKAMGQFRPQP